MESTIRIIKRLVTIEDRMESVIRILLSFIRAGHPLVATASGGKDSSVVTLLMLEAVRRAQGEGIDQARHFISHASTGVENPSMQFHAEEFLDQIHMYCARNRLHVSVHTVEPSLAAQFVVSTIGRGTLLRTPTTSGKKDGKGGRACSKDWKVIPQTKLRNDLAKEIAAAGFLESITLLGTRFDESAVRAAAMVNRKESTEVPVRNDGGHLTLSCIADWSTDDVWECLSMFMDASLTPFPAPVPPHTITRMFELYRDANEGVCGVNLGNGGYRAPCSSRFGCAVCGISGDKDRSMEAMIKDPKHAHLAGLNRFRNYLVAKQWDLSRRELVGRKLSPAGYLRVAPDTYSYAYRIELLRYLLTLDALEVERAEKHEADLVSGRIPDNEANRDLCGVQFEFITPRKLVAIDFQLSLHHYCPHAFPAVSEWFEIRELGKRYHVPDHVTTAPKTPIPSHGWYKVGAYDDAVPTDGLRSYAAELWNPYRHPDRVASYKVTKGGERMVYFEEEQQLDVDAVDANLFVTGTFNMEMLIEARMLDSLESARFWLNETLIKFPSGKAGIYQNIARRGQYFKHLAMRLNCTPAELDQYLISNAISESQHDLLIGTKELDDLPLFADLGLPGLPTDEDEVDQFLADLAL